MPEASNTVTVLRPVAEVFAFLSNPENDPQWRSGVLVMTKAGGDRVGATYRQVVSGPGGRRIDADIELTEYLPDQRIAFRTIKGPVRPTGSYDLRATDGGTQVTFNLSAQLTGFKKAMGPMVTKTMKSEVAALENLKRVLEGHPGTAAID